MGEFSTQQLGERDAHKALLSISISWQSAEVLLHSTFSLDSQTPDKCPSPHFLFLFHPSTEHHFSFSLLLQISAHSPSPCLSLLLSPSAHSPFFDFILLSHPFLSPSLSVRLCVWLLSFLSSPHLLSAFVFLKCEKRNGKIWAHWTMKAFRWPFPSCILFSPSFLCLPNTHTQTVFQSVYLQSVTLPLSQATFGEIRRVSRTTIQAP